MGTYEDNFKDLRRKLYYYGEESSALQEQERTTAAIIADYKEIVAAAKNVHKEITELISESACVDGYHLNGDCAPWDYFTDEDGLGLDRLQAAITRMEGIDDHQS